MLTLSDGWKAAQLAAFGPKYNGGAIGIFDCARPARPALAPVAAPIAWITKNGVPWTPGSIGAGLQFLQDGPLIVNDQRQAWRCQALVPGTARWFRLFSNDAGETFGYNEQFSRIDGDVALIGSGSSAELQLMTVNLVLSQSIPVDFFLYTIPPVTGA